MGARRVLLLSVFTLLSWTGCRRIRTTADSHDAMSKVLRDAEIAEELAWSSKDIERTLSFYGDDAIVMNPKTPTLTGRDQIAASTKLVFADPSFTIQYQINKVELAQSGELGYTQGTYTGTSTGPITKKPVADRGTWLTVRRKQAHGNWKIVLDVSNSDRPLPTPGK